MFKFPGYDEWYNRLMALEQEVNAAADKSNESVRAIASRCNDLATEAGRGFSNKLSSRDKQKLQEDYGLTKRGLLLGLVDTDSECYRLSLRASELCDKMVMLLSSRGAPLRSIRL